MIDLPFDPDLMIGPLALSWHSLFGMLALVAGVGVGVTLGARGLGHAAAYNVALAGVVGGLVGSRAFHVVDEWSRYSADPASALAVWGGGASITGGIAGGVIAGALAGRLQRVPLRDALDAGAAALPVGMAVGRIGDVVNGEHWATSCAGLPWCVRYTHPDTFGQREYVHPAVAYEGIADLAIAGVVLWLRRRGALEGRRMFVFLGLYGAVRLALAAVRLDPPFLGALSQAQLVSLGFLAVSALGLAARRGAYPRPR